MLLAIKRTFLTGLFWLLGMSLLLLPLTWFAASHSLQLEHIRHIISQNSLIFTWVRLCLILGLFFSWNPTVYQYSVKRSWPIEKTQFWLSKRERVIFWLIMFELFICENVILALLQLIGVSA